MENTSSKSNFKKFTKTISNGGYLKTQQRPLSAPAISTLDESISLSTPVTNNITTTTSEALFSSSLTSSTSTSSSGSSELQTVTEPKGVHKLYNKLRHKIEDKIPSKYHVKLNKTNKSNSLTSVNLTTSSKLKQNTVAAGITPNTNNNVINDLKQINFTKKKTQQTNFKYLNKAKLKLSPSSPALNTIEVLREKFRSLEDDDQPLIYHLDTKSIQQQQEQQNNQTGIKLDCIQNNKNSNKQEIGKIIVPSYENILISNNSEGLTKSFLDDSDDECDLSMNDSNISLEDEIFEELEKVAHDEAKLNAVLRNFDRILVDFTHDEQKNSDTVDKETSVNKIDSNSSLKEIPKQKVNTPEYENLILNPNINYSNDEKKKYDETNPYENINFKINSIENSIENENLEEIDDEIIEDNEAYSNIKSLQNNNGKPPKKVFQKSKTCSIIDSKCALKKTISDPTKVKNIEPTSLTYFETNNNNNNSLKTQQNFSLSLWNLGDSPKRVDIKQDYFGKLPVRKTNSGPNRSLLTENIKNPKYSNKTQTLTKAKSVLELSTQSRGRFSCSRTLSSGSKIPVLLNSRSNSFVDNVTLGNMKNCKSMASLNILSTQQQPFSIVQQQKSTKSNSIGKGLNSNRSTIMSKSTFEINKKFDKTSESECKVLTESLPPVNKLVKNFNDKCKLQQKTMNQQKVPMPSSNKYFKAKSYNTNAIVFGKSVNSTVNTKRFRTNMTAAISTPNSLNKIGITSNNMSSSLTTNHMSSLKLSSAGTNYDITKPSTVLTSSKLNSLYATAKKSSNLYTNSASLSLTAGSSLTSNNVKSKILSSSSLKSAKSEICLTNIKNTSTLATIKSNVKSAALNKNAYNKYSNNNLTSTNFTNNNNNGNNNKNLNGNHHDKCKISVHDLKKNQRKQQQQQQSEQQVQQSKNENSNLLLNKCLEKGQEILRKVEAFGSVTKLDRNLSLIEFELNEKKACGNANGSTFDEIESSKNLQNHSDDNLKIETAIKPEINNTENLINLFDQTKEQNDIINNNNNNNNCINKNNNNNSNGNCNGNGKLPVGVVLPCTLKNNDIRKTIQHFNNYSNGNEILNRYSQSHSFNNNYDNKNTFRSLSLLSTNYTNDHSSRSSSSSATSPQNIYYRDYSRSSSNSYSSESPSPTFCCNKTLEENNNSKNDNKTVHNCSLSVNEEIKLIKNNYSEEKIIIENNTKNCNSLNEDQKYKPCQIIPPSLEHEILDLKVNVKCPYGGTSDLTLASLVKSTNMHRALQIVDTITENDSYLKTLYQTNNNNESIIQTQTTQITHQTIPTMTPTTITTNLNNKLTKIIYYSDSDDSGHISNEPEDHINGITTPTTTVTPITSPIIKISSNNIVKSANQQNDNSTTNINNNGNNNINNRKKSSYNLNNNIINNNNNNNNNKKSNRISELLEKFEKNNFSKNSDSDPNNNDIDEIDHIDDDDDDDNDVDELHNYNDENNQHHIINDNEYNITVTSDNNNNCGINNNFHVNGKSCKTLKVAEVKPVKNITSSVEIYPTFCKEVIIEFV